MKKLLGLIGTITIAGSGMAGLVGNSPAPAKNKINYSQTDNLGNLNRVKREKNGWNQIEKRNVWPWSENKARYSASFKPDFWEEVIILHQNSFDFPNKFADKVINGAEFDGNLSPSFGSSFNQWISMERLGEFISNNWHDINHTWENSNRQKRIRIYFDGFIQNIKIGSHTEPKYYNTIIKTDDTISYSNIYLDNLKNDFKDFYKNSINLGLIDDNDNITILNAIKKQNPNLKISHLEVFNKEPYSHFTYNFSAKIKINKQSTIYSKFILNPKITYVTKEFLENDLSKLIDKDNLIENWNLNFNSWENEVNRQIKEDVPSFTLEQKRTWKGDKFNNLNDKLLSLQHMLTTIDLKFKANELYDSLEKLKEDVNKLKEQILNLNNEINNIKQKLEEDKKLKMCSDVSNTVSSVAGFIPKVGKIISAVAKVTGVTCKIISILN